MRLVKKTGLLLLLLSILFTFSACKNKTGKSRIYLKDIASYSFQQDGEYKKLEKWNRNNLYKLTDHNDSYIWLKFEFQIPPELQNKNLSFLVSYIHFAEKVWFNDVYIGSNGVMPEDGKELSSRYDVHYYELPKDLQKQNGTNTLLMKVYTKGLGEISGLAFIGESITTGKVYKRVAFFHTIIYVIVTGGPFSCFVLFLTLYITRKKRIKHNLYFSLLSLSSVIFLGTFIASEIPWYTSGVMSYLAFIKVSPCISFYYMIYFLTTFSVVYVYGAIPKKVYSHLGSCLAISIIATLAAPNLKVLMMLTYPMLILCFFQWIVGVIYVIKALKNQKRRRSALLIISCFFYFYLGILGDIVIRLIFSYSALPYISIFGFQFSLVCFIVVLSRDINGYIEKNEYLNDNMAREIQLQTVDITFANEKLEQEALRNKRDLDMAGLVQEKFMPSRDAEFESWELAVAYEPLEKVSGDLYDFYSFDGMFDGLAIFDASGHGISASLITMLSKSIIFKAFKKSYINKLPISSALLEINEKFIKVKGGVDNYLTGILLKINDDNDRSKIDLASAGHPYPVLYSNKTNSIEELLPDVNNAQFGAIGIPDIEVSFPDIEFEMNSGDILVLFTDGVIESANEDHEQFGRKRLEQVIMENHDLPISELRNKIINNLNGFMGETLRDDDVTFVILKKK